MGFRGSPDTHTWPVSPVWGVSGPLLLDPGPPRPPSHGLPGTLGQARASQLLRAGVPHVRAPASGALGSGDERTQVCLVLRHPPGSLPVLSSVQSRGWGTPGAPPLHAAPPNADQQKEPPATVPGGKGGDRGLCRRHPRPQPRFWPPRPTAPCLLLGLAGADGAGTPMTQGGGACSWQCGRPGFWGARGPQRVHAGWPDPPVGIQHTLMGGGGLCLLRSRPCSLPRSGLACRSGSVSPPQAQRPGCSRSLRRWGN